MITLHFHLQPQYKYELFHINFTSFHFTGRYELNKLTSLPMCGFIAQLVGIAPVSRRSRVRVPLKPWFFQASHLQLLKLENLLRWSLFTSYTTAVQIWIISYILHRDWFLSQIIKAQASNFQRRPWSPLCSKSAWSESSRKFCKFGMV